VIARGALLPRAKADRHRGRNTAAVLLRVGLTFVASRLLTVPYLNRGRAVHPVDRGRVWGLQRTA
jgi:hypothetical protein